MLAAQGVMLFFRTAGNTLSGLVWFDFSASGASELLGEKNYFIEGLQHFFKKSFYLHDRLLKFMTTSVAVVYCLSTEKKLRSVIGPKRGS